MSASLHNTKSHASRLTPLLLCLLLTACASQPSAPAATVPPLPPEAEPPALPAMCSPTCSAGVERLLQSWQQQLIEQQPPARPAPPLTTH